MLVAIFFDTLRSEGALPTGYGDFSVRALALKQIGIRDYLRRRDRRDRELTARLGATSQVRGLAG